MSTTISSYLVIRKRAQAIKFLLKDLNPKRFVLMDKVAAPTYTKTATCLLVRTNTYPMITEFDISHGIVWYH